ncbi:MAG TPA: aliphatic sulfonate ABC transporter substrate-binding protein [Thermomicrobiales bacterium]|nr:aliphatic sulfonate ABC transporter substrate-binding protein [Thermomicrobiales bacterium]
MTNRLAISSTIDRRRLLAAAGAAAVTGTLWGASRAAAQEEIDAPETLRMDYAYYNPSSLVLKRFGWIEEALPDTEVTWTLSAGSNKANEFLRSDAIDFASTAGVAAFLARANGTDLHTIYLYSQPEWTALVVTEDSEIETVEDLEGKKIAATKGTDPYFFLLQTLAEHGMSEADVEVVNLQHADGKTALERGDVDAWAGLDPHMAQTELEEGSRLIYRNIDFNTWGALNVREAFLEEYPEVVALVIEQYERARHWILENPDEAAQILSEEAGLSLEVAKKVLVERTNLEIDPVPGETQAEGLEPIIPILEAENQFAPGADPQEALDTLYRTEITEAVVEGEAP